MKVIDVVQGTPEWLAARAGIPTASELDQLLTPGCDQRTGEMPKTYLAHKLAERWTGFPLVSWSGGTMEQGSMLEGEAVRWYEAEARVDVSQVGFLTTDNGRFGCSPDGVVSGSIGLEIKCPQPATHVKWLLAGGVPAAHYLQCQGGMFATGFENWQFVAYCRGFPALMVIVQRDELTQDAIRVAVDDFTDKMASAWDRLCAANGGPPLRVEQTENDNPFCQ